MNKSQLIVLWIGAAFFIFCLWNPAIAPHTRYRWEEKEYTDKEWERELSHYNLSLADSKETLRNKKPLKDKKSLEDMASGRKSKEELIDEIKAEYIDMLLRGKRPTKRVKVNEHISYRRFFKTGSTSLLTRLLSVTVITALVVYTLADKNRDKVKEILEPIIRFEPKMENKPKDDQNNK